MRISFLYFLMMYRLKEVTSSSRISSRIVGRHFFNNNRRARTTTAFISNHYHHPSIKNSNRIIASPTTTSRLFSSTSTSSSSLNNDFFAPSDTNPTFESIGIQSKILLQRLETQLKLEKPSAVQASSYDAILEGKDVTIGAETGSGKTLAYLLPLIDDILQKKKKNSSSGNYDFARAVILVPNKELANQVIRMATPLCGGPDCVVTRASTNTMNEFTRGPNEKKEDDVDVVDPSSMVRLAVMPGGLLEPIDFVPFRQSLGLGGTEPPVDIVVSTPGAMGPLGLKPKNIDMFADIATLVVDEADMLLDGGYIRALENVLMGFRRADKVDVWDNKKTQHIFVAATLPNMGLRSVDSYLTKKFPYAKRVTMAGMHNAKHYGLEESTIWEEIENNKDRMARLVELLNTSKEEGGLKDEKVMIFLNSVDDVDGAHGALERAGFDAIRYHAKISMKERTENLNRYRNYDSNEENNKDTTNIMVCTDLASRGLDIPGVTVVVQLQFAGNVVAHLHRMGRCGRAGQRNGRGIIFYNSKQRDLITVVREAESTQESMILEGDVQEFENKDEENGAKVQKAFSRKRGFTKKIKKLRRDNNNSD